MGNTTTLTKRSKNNNIGRKSKKCINSPQVPRSDNPPIKAQIPTNPTFQNANENPLPFPFQSYALRSEPNQTRGASEE